MNIDIALTFAVLLLAVILLISEKVRVDLLALLILASLAVTGLVTPAEALSGFSNPAVVTVWAVFILSGGLSRTGVANMMGRQVLRLAGSGEARLLVVIMLTAGLMSAFMNNVGVAALMLPVVIHIARRTGISPSKLLMPLAFGALLGGLTTLIGTPPNILASDVLREYGQEPFQFFDFMPVGVILMLSGILFMLVVGRKILPDRDVSKDFMGNSTYREAFELQDRMIIICLPSDSILAGKTLAESRIGSATGLNVIGIIRNGTTNLSPQPQTLLQAGDRLLVAGKLDLLNELRDIQLPLVADEQISVESLVSEEIGIVEVRLADRSSLVGKTLLQSDFRNRFGVNVLAIRRKATPIRSNLQSIPLEKSDTLLVQASGVKLKQLQNSPELLVSSVESTEVYRLHEFLFAVTVPEDSLLIGKTLVESRLGDAYGLSVLGILRNGEPILMPNPEERLFAGDTLLVEGEQESLAMIRGLQKLEIDREKIPQLRDLESEQVGLVESVLSPRTNLVGSTLRDIHFREKFGLSVLAIWREGRVYRSYLRDMSLKFGDVLLLHGRWERLRILASEPDFILLAEEIQEEPRLKKAPIAALIMVFVVLSVILGWLPIAIAAILGGAVLVLTGCLTMEEAYRYIDWRSVFLIAGMIPLGIAMENSGAANFLAQGVVNIVGQSGATAIMAGLFLLTALASQVMPNPVVTVLMAPIAINTAVSLNLSPQALMMVVAISASASFLSPVGHPANVLIMGPGGYRFKDYMRVGIPLTVVLLILTLIVLPVFWPLSP